MQYCPSQTLTEAPFPTGSSAYTDRLIAVAVDSFLRKPGDLRPEGPVVLDLFAGAGGFSLGFHLAGAFVSAAVEIDQWACDTLRANHPSTKIVQTDLTELSDQSVYELGKDADIIIGGPPCQGFSVANIRAAKSNDPRNSLFREFIRAVELCSPRLVLMENVPGLTNRKTEQGEPVLSVIEAELKRLGYFPHVAVLHAMEYGVPQIRPRLFILAARKELGRAFPPPTHSCTSEGTLFSGMSDAHQMVTVWDAMSDLPKIEAREGSEVADYETAPHNSYQALLRADSKRLYNHKAMRHSARLVERFSKIKWGQSAAEAPHEHRARRRGRPGELSGKSYDQNNRRMFPHRPCHTVPASFYANFIHPFMNRNFTPREGARLQSFPDWYMFYGKPTVVSQKMLTREGRKDELHLCQYNQIGNAVPPLLAFHLAHHLTGLL